MKRVLVIGVATVLGACSAEETRTKPELPDLSALVEAYAEPSSDLDEAAAVAVQDLLEAKLRSLLELDEFLEVVDATLQILGDEEEEAGVIAQLRSSSFVLEGEGFVYVERICAGHGSPPPPIDDEVNGHLELTVGFTEDGIDAVVAGSSRGCKERVGAADLTFDGEVNLYVGTNLTLAQIVRSPVLFQLVGFALDVDGVDVLSGGFDLQVCRGTTTACVPGFIEVLLGFGSGKTLVFFFDPATTTGGFRAANGLWTCDFVGQTCDDGAGNLVTIPDYQL